MAIKFFQTRCNKCHTTENFKIGHDDSEESLDKAVEHLQGKTQIQVRSILRKHKVDTAEFGFALYHCPKCQILYNPYAVRVEYDDIMVFQPFYKCSVCDTTLQKATQAIENYACKQCAGKQLSRIDY